MTMRIKIQHGHSYTFNLEVENDRKILDVKSMIQSVIGVQPLRQSLIFRGTYLENQSSIKENKIENKNTLTLCIRESMTIYIKTHTGNMRLNVRLSSTIRDVKEIIQSRMDILPYRQNLVYGGRKLVDNFSLSDHKIYADESTIELFVKSGRDDERLITLSIASFTGNRHVLAQVSSRCTIRELKVMIEEHVGIPRANQHLLHLGMLMGISRYSGFDISDYHVKDGATIQLVDPSVLDGNMMISISIIQAAKTVCLDVDRSDKVGVIKERIEEMEDIPKKAQTLFFTLQRLDDDNRTLAGYNVTNQSTISLVYKQMRIHVRIQIERLLTFLVQPFDKTKTMRTLILEKEGKVYPDQQVVLPKNPTHEDTNESSFIFTKFIAEDERMITLWVQPSDKIKTIKTLIQEKETQFCPDQQVLLLDGKKLADEDTIESSFIFSNFIVDCYII